MHCWQKRRVVSSLQSRSVTAVRYKIVFLSTQMSVSKLGGSKGTSGAAVTGCVPCKRSAMLEVCINADSGPGCLPVRRRRRATETAGLGFSRFQRRAKRPSKGWEALPRFALAALPIMTPNGRARPAPNELEARDSHLREPLTAADNKHI